MKVIGYTRISDAEQSTDGLSLDTQRATIERYCEQRGWDLVEVIEDDGYTGRNDNRPGLRRAMAMLNKRKGHRPDAIVVARLDRLARSLANLITYIDRSREKRWGLVAIDMDLNTTSANGRLVIRIIASVAEWESEINSERTSAGMKAVHAKKRANGEVFGFPTQVDSQTVAHIIRARNRGDTFGAIARKLDRSTPPPGGGKRWYPSTVERIYKREAVA
jgi:DNA invertase Pin-like site-specific DNA recombinase